MNYLNNQNIRLRGPMEPEDLELLYTLENDPASWDISNFSVPYSRFQIRQFIENSQADVYADRQVRLMIERCSDHAVLGTADLDQFNPMHLHADVGIALLQTYRQQGYASEAVQLLADYAFGFLRLNQLTAHITASNEASLRLFRSAGFNECGLLRRWWRAGGEYKDVVILQRLRGDEANSLRE